MSTWTKDDQRQYDALRRKRDDAHAPVRALATKLAPNIGNFHSALIHYAPEIRSVLQPFDDTAQHMTFDEAAAYIDVRNERKRQDEQWGGADIDDKNTTRDWLRHLEKQLAVVRCMHCYKRARFVKIAALAVAAIESIDRRKAHDE